MSSLVWQERLGKRGAAASLLLEKEEVFASYQTFMVSDATKIGRGWPK